MTVLSIAAPDTTIIIAQHGQSDLTCDCIGSLRAMEPMRWPIIVVDDGSAPACPETVAAKDFAESCVVRQRHAGVSSAWNRGASLAETHYLLFLNNDVLSEGPAIDRLVEPLRSRRALVSGVATRRETLLPAETLQRLPVDRFLQGWCFTTSRESFQRMGGFDETMIVYWSDTDFQARIVAENREILEPLVCLPQISLRHLGHRTTRSLPNRRRQWSADRAVFMAKWNARQNTAN